MENYMSSRSRRNYSPAFLANAALSTQFDEHSAHITPWKAQILVRAAEVFEGGTRSAESPVDLKASRAKLGTLSKAGLENTLGSTILADRTRVLTT
jgi:hypothetical protein